jgi:hypothetical protein
MRHFGRGAESLADLRLAPLGARVHEREGQTLRGKTIIAAVALMTLVQMHYVAA